MSDALDVLKHVIAQLDRTDISGAGVMNDTSPDLELRYRAIIMERSGEERIKMGCSMFDAAPAEIRQAPFMQLYGDKFDAVSQAKILAAFESAGHPAAR